MNKGLVLACLLAIASTVPSNAAGNWQNRAYDATFSMTNSMGSGTWRTAADGHGHALVETKCGGHNTFGLVDGGTMYMVTGTPPNQTVMKMPFDESMASAQTAEDARKRNNTPLGMKIVAGHPAHGFKYSTAGGFTYEVWIADDIDFLVQSSSIGPNGTTSQTLQSFTTKAPAAASFALPAGARVIDIGAR